MYMVEKQKGGGEKKTLGGIQSSWGRGQGRGGTAAPGKDTKEHSSTLETQSSKPKGF